MDLMATTLKGCFFCLKKYNQISLRDYLLVMNLILDNPLLLKLKYPLQKWENNPILRAVSAPLTFPLAKEIKEFAHSLKELMYIYDGVWLAAPQVGKNIRMIAITLWESRSGKLHQIWDEILINPQIEQSSKQMNVDIEGCLSLPGIEWKVKRYNWVKVSFYDINGQKHQKIFYDFNARIVQHEIDHLDWILFIDKLEK